MSDPTPAAVEESLCRAFAELMNGDDAKWQNYRHWAPEIINVMSENGWRPAPPPVAEGREGDIRAWLDKISATPAGEYRVLSTSAVAASRDLLALLDAERAAREAAERERDALLVLAKESSTDLAWRCLDDGCTNADGRWFTGGMSDAEGFARLAGLELNTAYDIEDVKKLVPVVAEKMIADALSQPGPRGDGGVEG